MGYLSMGDTAGAPAFNCTKYAGVCKPSDQATLKLFQELQRQLNRAAAAKGMAKISVDGDIGPGTRSLAHAVGLIGVSAGTPTSTIAAGCVLFTSLARGLADEAGVAVSIAQPAAGKPPTIVMANGAEYTAPPTSIFGGGVLGSMSTGQKVAAAGCVAAIGFLLLNPRKTKRKGR